MSKLWLSIVCVCSAFVASSQSPLVVNDGGKAVVNTAGGGATSVVMVPPVTSGQQKITVEVENTPTIPLVPARRVALVVQNHCSGTVRPPMAQLADTLVARLSGSRFQVVNPQNVIGINQNRISSGEAMPEASVTELTRLVGAEGVLTASVLEFTSEGIGVPAVAYRLKARLALTLADGATGAAVCGVTVKATSPQYTAGRAKQDNATLFEQVLDAAAGNAADELLKKMASTTWEPGKQGVARVNFTCNVQGADVKVDGVAMGTVPALVSVPSGVHNIYVSYPFCVPYSTKAFFADGQTFNIVLQLDSTGRERFKNETLFAETVDRIRKTGATDDYVRKTLADGTSQYWKNSAVRIEKGEVKDLKLTPPGENQGLQNAPTVDQLMEKARGQ